MVAALAAGSGSAAAIPAPSENHTVTQPNGETFEAHQWGNEFNHGWETERGYTVTRGADGWWRYATSENGDLVPTDRRAGVDAPPSSVPKHVRGDAQTSPQLSSSQSDDGGAATSSTAPAASSTLPNTGTVDVPVVLVNYNDTATNHTNADFQALVFGDDPSVATGPGSVRDYFQEASYGQLDITGGDAGVVGWVTADHGHDYYGGSEIDTQTAELAREAVRKADDDVDFSQYDNNGDGVVDGVIVVHQGAGQETSGDPADIWSHRWTFESAGLEPYETDDGVTVNSYSLQPETQNGHLTTVGVVAHETGHLLGMTDLYDTDGSSEGIGEWGLMGSGSWNGLDRAGDSPAHPVAFHKSQQDWVTPTEQPLSGEMGVLDPYTGNASAFRWLENPNGVEIGGSGEYFLATNRRQTGFDRALPGTGMLVTHVDESQTSNRDEDHKLVDVEAADGNQDLDASNDVPDADAGDLFPGSTDAEAFNATTTPNSLLYDGSESGLNVTDLYVDGATIAVNPAPNASVAPSPAEFGDVRLTDDGTEVVTVANDGTEPLNLTNATIRGADAASYSITGGDGQFVLEPGAAANLTVEFAPSTRGSHEATLVTEHNASDSPTNVSLTGTGVAPDYDATPSPVVDFGNVSLEASPGQTSVVVANNGTAPLNLTDATLGGTDASQFSFAADSETPPTTVAPGSSVTYALNVTADTLGERTAYLELGHDVPDRGSLNLTLAATGVDRNPPTVRQANAVDAADDSAAVGPMETVTVSAVVRDAGAVQNVTVNASALGAGSVALTDGNDDHVYDAAVDVDAANATEGVHELTVEATDTRANAATNTTTPLAVDLTAPALDVASPGEGAVTNATTVDLTGTATDALTAVEAVEVRRDGGTWEPAALANGSWEYEASGLAEGTHELAVRATDDAGNSRLSDPRNVTVDVSPPTVEDASLGTTDGVLPGDALAVDVAANDSVSAIARVTVDGAALREGDSGWTGTTTAASALGPAATTVTVVDAAGNRNTTALAYAVGRNATLSRVDASTYRATPDGTPVVRAVTLNATTNVSGQQVTVGASTANPTAVPANDDAALYFPQVNTTVANANVTDATLSLRLPKDRFDRTYVRQESTTFWAFGDGAWSRVSANATDVTADAYWYDVRTTHFSAFAVTGDVEDTPPSITSVSPSDGSTTTDATPTIAASYEDGFSGVAPSSVTLSVDGTAAGSDLSVSASEVSYAPTLDPGTHSVTVEVADAAGNVESRSWTFTVEEATSANTGGSGGGGGSSDTGGGGSQPSSGDSSSTTTTATTTPSNTTTTTPTSSTPSQPSTTAPRPSTTAPTTRTTAPTSNATTRTTPTATSTASDTTSPASTTDETSSTTPGFGLGVAGVAALAAALLALRRDG